jgi:hypothetical protein
MTSASRTQLWRPKYDSNALLLRTQGHVYSNSDVALHSSTRREAWADLALITHWVNVIVETQPVVPGFLEFAG